MSLAKNTETSKKNTETVPPIRHPEGKTFHEASKLAIVEDKPIMMDYWVGSIEKSVILGIREEIDEETGEKITERLLVRSPEEFTSSIVNIYKVLTELIIMTENSIYIVDSKIPVKKIS